MLKWPPQYNRIVLEPGNEEVVHSGCSGGVNMGPLRTRLPSLQTAERQNFPQMTGWVLASHIPTAKMIDTWARGPALSTA